MPTWWNVNGNQIQMSRLLSKQKTDARSSDMEFLKLQEDSASPALKVRKEQKTEKEENKVVVKEKGRSTAPEREFHLATHLFSR